MRGSDMNANPFDQQLPLCVSCKPIDMATDTMQTFKQSAPGSKDLIFEEISSDILTFNFLKIHVWLNGKCMLYFL